MDRGRRIKMNTGTIIRTILVIATCLNTAMLSTDFAQFHNPKVDFAYKVISVVLNFVIVACATWFNNDYTPEACIGTGVTRQLKAEKDADYFGDYFFDENADAEEGVEGEEDEQSDI